MAAASVLADMVASYWLVTMRTAKNTRSSARSAVDHLPNTVVDPLPIPFPPFDPHVQIGTGFKDDELEKHAQYFADHVIDGPKPYYRCTDSVKPDHWFDAVQVWEVKAADLSISPVYTAAAGVVSLLSPSLLSRPPSPAVLTPPPG